VQALNRVLSNPDGGPTAFLYRLPKVISEKVGDALLGVAANRQVCPTFSEITFGNHSNLSLISPVDRACLVVAPSQNDGHG